MNNALATKINVFLIAGMKFDDSPGSEPYDVQFVKWITREKVLYNNDKTHNVCIFNCRELLPFHQVTFFRQNIGI